jgi:hypothetical protein
MAEEMSLAGVQAGVRLPTVIAVHECTVSLLTWDIAEICAVVASRFGSNRLEIAPSTSSSLFLDRTFYFEIA